MRLIKETHYDTLFTREFDSEMFLLLIKTFNEQVFDNEAFNNQTEQGFIVKFIANVFKSPSISFMLDFLSEAELASVNEIFDTKLDKVSASDDKMVFIKEILAEI